MAGHPLNGTYHLGDATGQIDGSCLLWEIPAQGVGAAAVQVTTTVQVTAVPNEGGYPWGTVDQVSINLWKVYADGTRSDDSWLTTDYPGVVLSVVNGIEEATFTASCEEGLRYDPVRGYVVACGATLYTGRANAISYGSGGWWIGDLHGPSPRPFTGTATISGATAGCGATIWFFQVYDPDIGPPASGNGAFTNSTTVSVGADAGKTFCKTGFEHPYWYVFASNDELSSPHNMQTPGLAADAYRVSSAGSVFDGNMAAQAFDLTGSEGSAAQGTHLVASAFTYCTAGGSTSPSGFVTSSGGAFGWLLANGDGACENRMVGELHSIVYDSVAPSSSITSLTLDVSSALVVGWTQFDPAPSGSCGYPASSLRCQNAQTGGLQIYYNATNTSVGATLCATVGDVVPGPDTSALADTGTSDCSVPGNGTWYIFTQATDRAGNVETLAPGVPTTITIPAPIVIGNSAPHIYQVGETIWFNASGDGRVDLIATTGNGESDIDHHRFGAPSSSSGWSPTSAVTAPSNPSTSEYTWAGGAADTTITVRAVDTGGNAGPGTVVTMRGDATGPALDWSYPDEGRSYIVDHDYLSDAESLNWAASDAESGLPNDGSNQIQQRQTATVVAPGECPTSSSAWANDGQAASGPAPKSANDLVSGHCYRWKLTATDNVGNSSSAFSGKVLVDTQGPVGMLQAVDANGQPISTTRNQDVTVICTCSDADSGIESVRYATDGGYDWNSSPWIIWPAGASHQVTLNSGSGLYTIMAQVKDQAGNIRTISTIITLQNGVTPPTLTAAAIIVDCAHPTDQSKWQLNITGVIYWPVGRPICLVPTVTQTAEGVDTRIPGAPKYGNLYDWWSTTPPPAAEPWLQSYALSPNLNDPAKTEFSVWNWLDPIHPIVWSDTYAGSPITWDPNAPPYLRFLITKETAALTNSAPYISVPYDLQATETWLDVSQASCSGPNAVPTPSPTPTPAPTPTPTPMPAPMATADTVYNGSFLPAYAIDGNGGTSWRSADDFVGAHWLQVDYGAPFTLSGGTITMFRGDIGTITSSDDGTTWTAHSFSYTARNTNPSSPYTNVFVLDTPATARYWRITRTAGFAGDAWQIYEFVPIPVPTPSPTPTPAPAPTPGSCDAPEHFTESLVLHIIAQNAGQAP